MSQETVDRIRQAVVDILATPNLVCVDDERYKQLVESSLLLAAVITIAVNIPDGESLILDFIKGHWVPGVDRDIMELRVKGILAMKGVKCDKA